MGMSSSFMKSKFRMPFFMVDWSNLNLIMLPNVPTGVRSVKAVKWVQTDLPGKSHSAMQFGNMAPTEVSFSIKVVFMDAIIGNQPYLKQFELLRNPVDSFASRLIGAKNPANPRVLFWYGTGTTIPLIYYVSQCDFLHNYFNKMGYPTVTDVEMKLILDEEHVLNNAEWLARQVLALVGTGLGAYKTISRIAGGSKAGSPYK